MHSFKTTLPMTAIALGLAATAAPILADPMNVSVPMRDGTGLDTYIFLPEGEGPFPTLIARSIYGPSVSPIGGELFDASRSLADFAAREDSEEKDTDDEGDASVGWPLLTENGYALVIQSTRGRFGSAGIDRTWLDDRTDGYDLVEWVDDQPWSNGRIGLFGDSAVGMSAALAAAEMPPALDALFLQATPGDPFGTDMAPRDGALRTESLLLQGAFLAFDVGPEHRAGRGIGADEVPDFNQAIGGYAQGLFEGLEDPLNSEAWAAAPLGLSPELDRLMPFWAMLRDTEVLDTYRDQTNVIGQINVPTSIVSLWQDTFSESTMALYADLEARGVPAELLVVNGTHYEIDDPRIFPAPRLLSWFDHWLKDGPAPTRDAAVLAVQNADEFIMPERVFELGANMERLAFGTDLRPRDGSTSFTSDPANPVPTLGGRNLLTAAGVTDHASLLDRDDLAVFVGDALLSPARIAGPVTGMLTMSADVPSFDVSVRLLDISPDGRAELIVSDHVRIASYAGETAEVRFDMGVIVHQLAAGHRVAVMLAGTDFPAWDRNPQTGGNIFSSSELQSGLLTLRTDVESYVDLPWDGTPS